MRYKNENKTKIWSKAIQSQRLTTNTPPPCKGGVVVVVVVDDPWWVEQRKEKIISEYNLYMRNAGCKL